MIGKFISGLGIVGVMVLAIFDTHGNSNCGNYSNKDGCLFILHRILDYLL